MNASRYSLPAILLSLTTAIAAQAAQPGDALNEERQPVATAAAKAVAAPRQRSIKLKSGEFLPAGDLASNLARAKAQHPEAKPVHVIVQFDELSDAARRTELEAAGIRLLGYLPDNAFFATVPLHLPKERLQAVGIVWLGSISATDKTASSLRLNGPSDRSQKAAGTVNLWVRYFEDVAPKDAEQALQKLGARILSHVEELQRIVVNVPAGAVNAVASADEVRWVQEVPPPPVSHNDHSRQVHDWLGRPRWPGKRKSNPCERSRPARL
jgi:hypothetical protein